MVSSLKDSLKPIQWLMGSLHVFVASSTRGPFLYDFHCSARWNLHTQNLPPNFHGLNHDTPQNSPPNCLLSMFKSPPLSMSWIHQNSNPSAFYKSGAWRWLRKRKGTVPWWRQLCFFFGTVAMAPGSDMGMKRRKFTASNDEHFKWGAIAEATFEQGEPLLYKHK